MAYVSSIAALASTRAFPAHVASLFATGGHGHFLVEDAFAFGSQFQSTLTSGGHTFVVGNAPCDLATLAQSDGVSP